MPDEVPALSRSTPLTGFLGAQGRVSPGGHRRRRPRSRWSDTDELLNHAVETYEESASARWRPLRRQAAT
jgi:hypothetical protein